MNVKETQIQSI